MLNDWTLTITSQEITQNAGATVTQGSVVGTLKTALTGASTSVVVTTTSGVTFVSSDLGDDVVIGTGESKTTIEIANVIAAANTGTTSVNIETTSGSTPFVTTADIIIGGTTVAHANVNTVTVVAGTNSKQIVSFDSCVSFEILR